MKENFLRAALELKDFNPAEPKVKEYRLMYFFGTWVTSDKIYAECDEEAIFEADSMEKKANDVMIYAVWDFTDHQLIKWYALDGVEYGTFPDWRERLPEIQAMRRAKYRPRHAPII